MTYLVDIMLECESKLNGQWMRKDELVHKIYLVKFGFRLGLNSSRAPYTGAF